MFDVGPVRERDELHQILALQRANLAAGRDPDDLLREGFVSLVHTIETLEAMHAVEPSLVARAAGEVIGYALVMPLETRPLFPELEPMLTRLDAMPALASTRYYVMGQVCVARSHRGHGVFDALYAAHRARLADRFDAVVTEIATRNLRSLRAHARVGFETLCTYRDDADEWAIVSWRWSE